jgi:lysozyme family protein
MQALDAASVAPIYQALVWNKVAGDALPRGVDLMVFDHAVLGGTATSAKALQEVLRVAVDGDIGPITKGAAKAASGVLLIGKLAWNQEMEYRSDADFSLFGNGWLSRLDARVAAALAMI